MYPKLKPGLEFCVPVKTLKGTSAVEILGIITGLATLAMIVITINNLNK